MRGRIRPAGVLCGLLLLVSNAQAQGPPPVALPATGQPVSAMGGEPSIGFTPCLPTQDWQGAAENRVSAGVDYLVWWIKDGPAPHPLVTTGDPANPLAGTIGQPDTR